MVYYTLNRTRISAIVEAEDNDHTRRLLATVGYLARASIMISNTIAPDSDYTISSSNKKRIFVSPYSPTHPPLKNSPRSTVIIKIAGRHL